MSQSLINKSNVRQFTMDAIKATRPGLDGKMTRVSGEFFTKVEAATRTFITHYVSSMPSSGKTIK